MKAIVIAAMACATAIICVLLLRVEYAPAQQRYQLYGVDETAPATGKTVKSVYRIDMLSGKTWRVNSKAFLTGTQDEQNKPMLNWADGWEEIPESQDAAVAKEQAQWRAAASYWQQRGTPSPSPTR
jgi:hypothetical protein